MTSEVMSGRPRLRYASAMSLATAPRPAAPSAFGSLLRRFRTGHRLTQEQLAADAEVSTRHLSCLESGKAQPSREMVLVLASALELELRDRNVLLGAAGFAPVYRASSLEAPAMAPVRAALGLLLRHHEPFGAVVLDRLSNVLLVNEGARKLLGRFLADPAAEPRVLGNVLHALFSPAGVRPFVVNWDEVATLALERLQREILLSPQDEERQALRAALLAYPGVPVRPHKGRTLALDPFVSLHLRRGAQEVRLFSALTTLGTPADITAQELTIESYFPADEASAALLRGL